jgi:hypothetical protein
VWLTCSDGERQELALTALDTTTGDTVTLDLATLPAGHAVLHGQPKAFEVHADEFWCVPP